jgi:tRNA (adenine22-N1)-methyltransferase
LGDGLQVLTPGEVEAVVIAGMGSAVIRGILERSPEVTGSLRRLICQPMAGTAQLRQWFQQRGWKLVEEDLVLEDGILYEILAAEPGETQPIETLFLEIGPLLWQNRHPLLREHLGRLLQKERKQSAAMAKSHDPDVLAKRESCQEKIRMLEGKIRCVSIVE